MDEGLDLQKEFSLHFHGINYIITLTVTNGDVMTLEAEQGDTNERWTGEFTGHYIEEITQKTGNYKKFGVFVKMLLTALARDSDSVFIDLLTNSDLEMLKARKTGQPLVNTSFSSNPKSQMKRYLILTYTVEFDRVHYPLPLAYEEDPNPAALKATIRRLRQDLEATRSGLTEPTEPREKELRQIIAQLRQENTQLRHRLRQLESRQKREEESGVKESPNKLRKQYESTKKQLTEITNAYEKLQLESAKELRRLRELARGNRSPSPASTRSARYQPPPAAAIRRSPSPSQRTTETATLRRELNALRRELNDSKTRLDREKTTTLALRSQLRGLKESQIQARVQSDDYSSRRRRSLSSRDSSPVSIRANSRTMRARNTSPTAMRRASRSPSTRQSSSHHYARPTSATSRRSRASLDSGYISPYSQSGYSSGGGSRTSARSNQTLRSASSRSSNASSTKSRKQRKPKTDTISLATKTTVRRSAPPTRPPKARVAGNADHLGTSFANQELSPTNRASLPNQRRHARDPAWVSLHEHERAHQHHTNVNSSRQLQQQQPKHPQPPHRTQTPSATNTIRRQQQSRALEFPIPEEIAETSQQTLEQQPANMSNHAPQSTSSTSLTHPPSQVHPEDNAISDQNTQAEITDIDKRIQALQSFLDKARSGILADLNGPAPAVPAAR